MTDADRREVTARPVLVEIRHHVRAQGVIWSWGFAPGRITARRSPELNGIEREIGEWWEERRLNHVPLPTDQKQAAMRQKNERRRFGSAAVRERVRERVWGEQ